VDKFCAECGTLRPDAPRRSAINPRATFCGEWDRLSTTVAWPARAERRVVSVLFADLVWFTPFSESRDPEEVRDMLTRYFERSREIV
jgi:class 3 adenylate cyclase